MKKIAIFVLPLVVIGLLAASGCNARRFGILVLNSSPWAYVNINGKRLNDTTPITGLRLPPGKYEIRLSSPVIKQSKTIQVQIQPGETTLRVVRLLDADDPDRFPDDTKEFDPSDTGTLYVSNAWPQGNLSP